MEPKELEKRIAESKHPAWFNETAELTFPLKTSKGGFSRKGLVSIYRYVLKEIKGFEALKDEMPSFLDQSRKHFEFCRDNLIVFVNNNLKSEPNILNSEWNQFKIRANQNLRNFGIGLMDAESPEVAFLVSISKENVNYAQGAFHFFCDSQIPNPGHIDTLIGFVKAYNFKFEIKSGIEKKHAGERISLGKLRASYQGILDEIQTNHVSHLSEERTKVKNFSQAIDALKESKERLFEEWYSDSVEKYKKLYKSIETKKEELENTYREHLTLDAPADYWKKRSLELDEDGHRYLFWLYWFIAISGCSLFFVLWQIPDGIFLNVFKGEASAIKWTVVYISFLSLIAFGIKTLSKLTYSTFHLKRDAEERYQLTHVYLALKKDASVEPEDRQLILQSLFSRADSGLLKDDSTPTMPGIIDSVLRNKQG